MNIVLCGMMGCGKTTVAEELKSRGFTVVDTDAVIVERYGEINGIFKAHGEKYFRDIESSVTAEIAQSYTNAVISLGGGCVLRRENVDVLRTTGKIFYLRTTPETIIKRLKGDVTRPLLAGDIEERVRTISGERAAIYEQAADAIIDTDGLTPQAIADRILGGAK